MQFSALFIQIIIIISLIVIAAGAIALVVMLVRDYINKQIW